jgi:hypothetical protein
LRKSGGLGFALGAKGGRFILRLTFLGPPTHAFLYAWAVVLTFSLIATARTFRRKVHRTPPQLNGLESIAVGKEAAPVKLGLKNIKAITRITYTKDDPADYWAKRGYSRYDGI